MTSTPPLPLRPNLRDEWLLDPRIAFMNHGSFGAVPRCVAEAQEEWRRRIEAEPVEIIGRRASGLIAEVKRAIGARLGMASEDFGLVVNATEGIDAVLASIDLRPGDELLTTSHVYNAVRQAMRHAAGRHGASYREIDLPLPVESSEQIERAVLEAVSSRTRLLVVDHITSPTAIVFPADRIAAACAERGVDVLVDGAHAPGMLPLDVPRIGATYYVGNLHKWTCAPRGSAFLWVRPERQSRIHPLAVSHNFGQGFVREFDWQGTRDLSAWLAIPAALEFMSGFGWERVMDHNHRLATWAHAMLCERWGVDPITPRDGRLLGSMCTVPLPPPLDALCPDTQPMNQRLYSEFGVEAPLVHWGGRTYIRPCCQLYNLPADYERLAEAIMTLSLKTRTQSANGGSC